MMIYTGAPQNTIRKQLDPENIKQAHELLEKNLMKTANVILHAPHIINLAPGKRDRSESSKTSLIQELRRVSELGLKYFVSHPGSGLDQDRNLGAQQIVDGINYC